MELWKKEPLGFGEVLDLTFRIVKVYFSKIYLYLLILIGPIYLIDALASWTGGAHFFREPLGTNNGRIDAFINKLQGGSFDPNALDFGTPTSWVLSGIVGLLTLILMPMAHAGILLIVGRVRNGEERTEVGLTIKQAFARFWPLIGSILLFALLFTIFFGVALGLIATGIGLSIAGVTSSVETAILVTLGIAVIVFSIYFVVRWSFYFAAVVFEKVAPGLSTSWRLTRRNFWRLIGLYIILAMITSILSSILSIAIQGLLGTSVIATVIQDLVSLIATMILFVGYGVVYFDLRIRNGAEDIKDLIADYSEDDLENPNDKPVD